MLVLRLMRGGCLQRALQDPERHEALAWHNRYEGSVAPLPALCDTFKSPAVCGLWASATTA